MTLHSTISQRMQEDLQALQAQLDNDTAVVESDLQHSLQDEQRMYKEMVEDVITEQVHITTYNIKQGTYFDSVSHQAEAIETAYINVLPKLIDHSIFAEQLKHYLKGVDASTEVTVTGKFATQLSQALHTAGHKAVKSEPSEDLGGLSYVEGERRAELSLHDFLTDVKKKTIQYVTTAI